MALTERDEPTACGTHQFSGPIYTERTKKALI